MDEPVKTVLVTAAHPDDTEFVCGGTVAKLARQGAEITVLVVTSGEAGLPADTDHTMLREAEQQAAADVLGVKQVQFLRFPDGAVEPTRGLRREVTAVIRTVRPELLITHTPHRNLRSVRSSHPDHLAVGQATLAAVYPDARNERAYPELLADGLAPHITPEVWLHGTESCDTAIDISEEFDVKMEAVQCHRSQLAGLGTDPAEFFREWGVSVADRHGLPTGRLAEEFLKLDTR